MKHVAWCVSLLFACHSTFGSVHFAETTKGVHLRMEATKHSMSQGVLPPRTKLMIFDPQGSWYRARVVGTDLSGWVFGEYVELGVPHSEITIHRAVLHVFPEYVKTLTDARVPIAHLVGDTYDNLNNLVVAFGPGASPRDLKAIVDATGPNENVYLAPVTGEELVGAIYVGASVGTSQRVASVKDIYSALEEVSEIDVLASIIQQRGKRLHH